MITVTRWGRQVTISVLLLAAGAVPALAQRDARGDRDDRGDDRVCFYRDVQFQGQSWCFRPGDELADLGNRRNEISSIRISGRARVVVFDEREFAGASDEFDMDVPDLTLRNMEGRRTWNDRIESFRIAAVGRERRGLFGRDRDDDRGAARDRICVFDEPNYRGRSQCWDAGEEESNLNRTNGWNDRIASIRVFGRTRAEVYRDANFRGARLRVDRDIPDLSSVGWSAQISSFTVGAR